VHEQATIAQTVEVGAGARQAAGRQPFLDLDQHAGLAALDRPDGALEHGLLMTLDVDLDEAAAAFVDLVETRHRHLDALVSRIGRRGVVRHGRAAGHHHAVDHRHAQLDRAGLVRQGDRFDRDVARKLLAQRLSQCRHRLVGEDMAGVPPHVVDVGAVVGADVDRIGVAAAQEFEQMQFDLAVAAVETGLAPVKQRLRTERPQGPSRFAVRIADVEHGWPHLCCRGILFKLRRGDSRVISR